VYGSVLDTALSFFGATGLMSIIISSQIDQAKIKAEYNNGVLRLSLPKAEEAKKRKIDVKVA